jgi:hypothetical protein
MSTDQPKCSRWGCGSNVLVGPLHGTKGGPLLCIDCRFKWDEEDKRERRRKIDVVEGFGFKIDGLKLDEPCYLTTETLEDAIFLTHPDRHPVERKAIAERATKELLALRGYTRPRPAPKPAPTVTDNQGDRGDTLKSRNALKPKYCEACFLTVPFYYCDACREKWEAEQRPIKEAERRKMDRQNERARQHRKKQRLDAIGHRKCPSCGTLFDGRKDAKFCSSRCRQKAHRRCRKNRTPL